MSRDWGTSEVDVVSLARVWDELLRAEHGGKDSLQGDRDAVEEMCQVFSGWRELAEMQRHFTVRAVDYLVGEVGVTQLVEIGCGFPPVERKLKLHEIARLSHEDARVVYVDNDPLVVAHARAIMAGPGTAAIQADVTDPASILEHRLTRKLLDLDRPYAVLLSGVLQHVPDDQSPVWIVDELKAAMRPGCYLAVCNLLGGDALGVVPAAEEAEQAWDKAMAAGGGGHAVARFRTWAEQRPYLRGLDLVEPGFVYADEWWPDEHLSQVSPEHTLMCAGIGRIPGTPS